MERFIYLLFLMMLMASLKSAVRKVKRKTLDVLLAGSALLLGCGDLINTAEPKRPDTQRPDTLIEQGYDLKDVYEERGHSIPIYSDRDDAPIEAIQDTLAKLSLSDTILQSGIRIIYSVLD